MKTKTFGPAKPPSPKKGSALDEFYKATGYDQREARSNGARGPVSEVFVRSRPQDHGGKNPAEADSQNSKSFFAKLWVFLKDILAITFDWRLFIPAAAMSTLPWWLPYILNLFPLSANSIILNFIFVWLIPSY